MVRRVGSKRAVLLVKLQVAAVLGCKTRGDWRRSCVLGWRGKGSGAKAAIAERSGKSWAAAEILRRPRAAFFMPGLARSATKKLCIDCCVARRPCIVLVG